LKASELCDKSSTPQHLATSKAAPFAGGGRPDIGASPMQEDARRMGPSCSSKEKFSLKMLQSFSVISFLVLFPSKLQTLSFGMRDELMRHSVNLR
jgi:hypothetical protein